MKKVWIILASVLLILMMVACGKKGNSGQINEKSLGGALYPAFEELVEQGLSAEEIAAALATDKSLPFSGVSMVVEEGALLGFDKEITGFSSGAMFGPIVGTTPFVGYVFELKTGENGTRFMDDLEKSGNLRWNICTAATDMSMAQIDNMVFFVMSTEVET